MSVFVEQNKTVCDFANSDSWVILTEIEQSIKRKIEAVGTPLKDWDIQINYCIKTGFNDAFVISTEKRNEILANCATEDERARTEELIRPILRGRDIKRYGYDWANLWLINTHNGVKGKIPRVDINDYPAIKAHLDQYWHKLKSRADKGDTPYNLRNCAYLEDFQKPKIMYSEIVHSPKFYLDSDGSFVPEATTFIMTGVDLEYLYNIFHSGTFTYFFKRFYAGGGLGDEGYRYKKAFFERVPVPKMKRTQNQIIIESGCHNNCLELEKACIGLFDFTPEEIKLIESQYIQ